MSDLLLANSFETGLNTSTLANSEFDAVSVVAGGTLAVNSTARVGGYSLNTATGVTSGVSYGEWDWGSNEATVYVHLFVRFGSVPGVITAFASIYDTTPALIGDLRVNASGLWEFFNNGDSTAYTSTGLAILANMWYEIELKLFGDAAAGTIDWKTNNILEPGISGLTGKNTKPGNFPRRLRVGVTAAQANAPARLIDDVIVRNGGWSGPANVLALAPYGDVSHNWTIVDAGTTLGYKTQLERPWASNATDMVKSSTASQVERWSLQPVGQTASGLTIIGAQPMIRQRRAVAGSAAGVLIDVGGGASNGTQSGAKDAGSTTWTTFRGVVQDTDPATGVAWTLAGINAARLRLVRDANANECDVNASLVYVAFTQTQGNQNQSQKGILVPRASLETYKRRGRQKHSVAVF